MNGTERTHKPACGTEKMIWRTFPIFVSSTFKDMEGERDYLKANVIPRLEEKYAPYRIAFKAIDLRWGVNTAAVDEQEREAKVLKVCLDSVVNNRPFFIALIGDRYGWIPPEEHLHRIYASLSAAERDMLAEAGKCSVTELEIILGALGDPENILSRSLFYFRTPDSYDGMSRADAAVYKEDAEDPDLQLKTEKLKQLKARIVQACLSCGYTGAVHNYSLKWNGERFDDFEQWGDMVFENMCREIDEEVSVTESALPSDDIQREQARQEEFVYRHTGRFVGREELIGREAGALMSGGGQKILTGFSGSGKSAFMCKMYETLSASGEAIVLFNSAGCSHGSQTVEQVMKRWSRQLCDAAGYPYESLPPVRDADKAREKAAEQFRALAGKAVGEGFRVIILADALDRFESNRVADYLTWLPDNAAFLATAIPGTEEKPLKLHKNLKCEPIPLFDEALARQMLRDVCEYYGKDIHASVIEALLSRVDGDGRPSYESPLWLSLVANVLIGLDADDFAEIRNMKETAGEELKIERFMCGLANSFAPQPGELFIELLERAGKEFGRALVFDSVRYIALSRSGLREKDLAALLGEGWDELRFASARRWFRQLLAENGDRQWMLSHAMLKERFMGEADAASGHRRIAEYLIALPEGDPVRTESLFWHLLAGRMDDRLADRYGNGDEATRTAAEDVFEREYSREGDGFLDRMAEASAHAGSNHTAVLYFCHFIRDFAGRFYLSNPRGIVRAGRTMLEKIDTNHCTPEEARWLGSVCNDLTTYSDRLEDWESLHCLATIQIALYRRLLGEEPAVNGMDTGDIDAMKGVLAQALFKIANYYSEQGDMAKAFECYDMIDEL